MSNKDLKYTATLDASGVKKGAADAEKAIDKMADGIVKDSKQAQQALAQLAVATNKVDSTLAKGAGVAKSTKDFTGLSRVIQDLPFGFIGIQNNITQLLPAAGALGLALSVITAAVTFASTGLANWTRGFESNEKAVKKAKDTLEEYKESVRSNQVEFEKQRATLEGLVSVVRSDVASKDQQARALERLNKLIPDNIGVLTMQNIKTAEGTKILNEYTKAIEARGIAELLSARIAELSVQRIDAQAGLTKDLTTLILRQTKAQQDYTKQMQSGRISNNDFAKEKALRTEILNLQGQQTKLVNDFKKGLTDLNSQIANYRKEATAAFMTASPLDQFDKEKVEKAKANIRTIQDVLAELRRELDFLSAKGIAFNTNEEKAKIQAITQTIENLIKNFKVAPNDTIIAKLFGDIESLRNRIKPQEIQKVVIDAAKTLGDRGITVPVTPVLNTDSISTFLVDATDKVADAMSSLMENIAYSIGDTLGKALAGSASIGDFFKGIFSQLGAAMQQLGKFFIETGIQIKIIKQFLIKNPVLAIAGGIALVALGSLIKAKTDVPGFATGVRNFDGGIATVGERGPETVFLPRGASVLPAAQTSAGLSGQSVFIPDTIIKGQDIVISYKRTQAALGRTG